MAMAHGPWPMAMAAGMAMGRVGWGGEERDVPKHPRGCLKADFKGVWGAEKAFGFKSPSGDLKPNTGSLKADIKGGVGGGSPYEKN